MEKVMRIWYDKEGDFLELIFEDAEATLEEIGDDLFERRTPGGRVIGYAVFNFSQHDREELQLPVQVQPRNAA